MTSLKTNTETSTARTIHKQQGMNSVIGVEFNDPRLVCSSSATIPKDNMAKLTHAEKSEEYVIDDNEEPPPVLRRSASNHGIQACNEVVLESSDVCVL